MSKTVHIVCLDCPSPPDYGGAMDMFYKIKALHETGWQIILHYFDYKPLRTTKEIEPFCTEIYKYERTPVYHSLPLSRPYIVQSRINKDLVLRLNNDTHPILLEGLHCSGIVPQLKSKERIVLRMHNDEAAYYHRLAKTETSLLKRSYFLQESRLLHRYQSNLDKAVRLAVLSTTDKARLENEYGFGNAFFLPLFLPWQEVKSKTGRGDYCIYHGNLAVPENGEAALWLIDNVFALLPVPFVIAGNGIPKNLFALAKKHPHIVLVNNPPADEMNALVSDAHIQVLPSFNATGVKLKLLNALLNGRFCLTNAQGLMGSGVEKGVLVKENAADWLAAIAVTMEKKFSEEEIAERNEILSLYDNRQNAANLSAEWLHCQ